MIFKSYLLIQNNILSSDLDTLIKYLKEPSSEIKLTAARKIEEFEKLWSK